MESMSRTERAALCNSALEAGEQAPTLCGRWTVKDLVIHLLIRERDPLSAPGIVVPRLERLTDRSARRLMGQDFSTLVERLRSGPPTWSPMSLPPLDRALNTLEFFVHHEDIRRAATEWEARELTEREQKVIWKAIKVAGKGLVRPMGVPVVIRWSGDERERSAVLRKGEEPVVVTGLPAEVTMFLFGREQHTGLVFDGPVTSVKKLTATGLGL
jgi:uncharacterized protein (TIGR03085 family)